MTNINNKTLKSTNILSLDNFDIENYIDLLEWEEINNEEINNEEINNEEINNEEINNEEINNKEIKISECKIIGFYEINKNLNYLTYGFEDKIFYAYLILYQKQYYLSINVTQPKLWYLIKTIEEIKILLDSYNPESYMSKLTNTITGYINMNNDPNDFENYLLTSNNTEILIWGNNYNDYPFRKIYSRLDISKKEHIVYVTKAQKQLQSNPYEINVRTLFSKSKINVIFDEKLKYNLVKIVIKYNPIKIKNNNLVELGYCETLPVDVINTLINLNEKFYNELNIKKELEQSNDKINLYIACQIYKSDLTKLNKLKISNTSKNLELINEHIQNIKIKKIFNSDQILRQIVKLKINKINSIDKIYTYLINSNTIDFDIDENIEHKIKIQIKENIEKFNLIKDN
tara:strand:+ start:312 stop:1517 length:1206 start_codon:yes stop_codon:yes gene_type:complete